MDALMRLAYPLGSLLAAAPSVVPLESWVSAVGSLGGFGVLIYAVSYTMRLLHQKDVLIAARDAQLISLTNQLISKCGNCDLAKAANKKLIDE